MTYSTVPKNESGEACCAKRPRNTTSSKEELWKKDDDHNLGYDTQGHREAGGLDSE